MGSVASLQRLISLVMLSSSTIHDHDTKQDKAVMVFNDNTSETGFIAFVRNPQIIDGRIRSSALQHFSVGAKADFYLEKRYQPSSPHTFSYYIVFPKLRLYHNTTLSNIEYVLRAFTTAFENMFEKKHRIICSHMDLWYGTDTSSSRVQQALPSLADFVDYCRNYENRLKKGLKNSIPQGERLNFTNAVWTCLLDLSIRFDRAPIRFLYKGDLDDYEISTSYVIVESGTGYIGLFSVSSFFRAMRDEFGINLEYYVRSQGKINWFNSFIFYETLLNMPEYPRIVGAFR